MSFAKWISKTNVCRAQVVEKALFWNFYTSSWTARSVRSVRPSNKTWFSIVANHRCHETMVFQSTIQQRYIPTTKCPKKFRKSLHLTGNIGEYEKKKNRKKKQSRVRSKLAGTSHDDQDPTTINRWFLPSNISGARYHNVMTLGDNFAWATGCGMKRAMPKSAILMTPRLLYNKFDIFKSRWTIRRSCKCCKPDNNPNIKRLTPPSPNLQW